MYFSHLSVLWTCCRIALYSPENGVNPFSSSEAITLIHFTLPVSVLPMIQPTHLLGLPAYFASGSDRGYITNPPFVSGVRHSRSCLPALPAGFSSRHSPSTPTLLELPCGGKAIRPLIIIRRLFCPNTVCPRNICAEQLPDLTRVDARRTTRCQETLAQMGFAPGGKAAATSAAHLGVQGFRITTLKILRQTPEPARISGEMNVPCVVEKRMFHPYPLRRWNIRRSSSWGRALILFFTS